MRTALDLGIRDDDAVFLPHTVYMPYVLQN